MTEQPRKHDLVQRFFCLFGKHKRNAKRARRRPDAWYSVCTGCGGDMIKRDEQTGWVLLRFQRRKRHAGGMKKRRH